MIEGSSVSLVVRDKKLLLIPANGESGVKVSIDGCGSSRLGSNPSSGLNKIRGDKNER